ncbi:PhoH family protein [Inmirania thermothiophila]|nr:PhoH family protein [Inmirania thermothiophila]
MHDPTALFRFQEHDVFLPMVVLEELDDHKRGLSEVARNVRQVSRFLDELMAGRDPREIEQGLPLPAPGNGGDGPAPRGRLFFQTRVLDAALPRALPGHKADHDILAVALALRDRLPETTVVIVSKDINLRIKAAVLGLNAEDYRGDKVLDDVSLLYRGYRPLPPGFWQRQGSGLESWSEGGRAWYRVRDPEAAAWYPGEFVYDEGDGLELVVRGHEDGATLLELATDYREGGRAVWGIHARNREQGFALNLLMDPEIDFVTLLGAAGTGKTLLALAAALAQTLDENRYREIVMTRVTVPLGEDIGFLPGTEEEKMTPWMGALMDNLEVLAGGAGGGSWGRGATQDLMRSRIKVRSLNFMRGRTFLGTFLILDEAQNMTPKQIKALVTRAGPGTKVVCLGNVAQIDTPYLTETTSGITYAVDRFKDWPHSGHVTLQRVERSRLADHASEVL